MVIPLPVKMFQGCTGAFSFARQVSIIAEDESLNLVISTFTRELEQQAGITLTQNATGASIRLSIDPTDPELAKLPPTGGIRPDSASRDSERYLLDVNADTVTVRGASAEGVYRGLTTLCQLLGTGSAIEAVTIVDSPRFGWRGFSLDTARTFWPMATVKQIIELLALYKFNVLHLHLNDSEGWRLEIPSRPELTAIGSGVSDSKGFYSVDDYAELIAFASERFITIVPEIDMPGHAVSALASYPELSGDGSAPGREDMAARPGIVRFLHPDNPALPAFLTDVLNDVAAMTPGEFLHIGGDEPFGMPDDLYAQFMRLVRPIAQATGKQLVSWQETARVEVDSSDVIQFWLSFDPARMAEMAGSMPEGEITLPNGMVLTPELITTLVEDVMRSQGDLPKALAQGARIIASLNTHNYLDTMYSESSADPAQETLRQTLGMPFYPKSTVAEYLDWDPVALHEDLTEESLAGVEAAIWCESIRDQDGLFFLLLPRLAGIAERAWSPTGTTDWENYRQRLAAQAPIWMRSGWTFFKSSLVEWPDL